MIELTIEYRELSEFLGYRFGSDGSVWSSWRKGPNGHCCATWRQLRPIANEGGYLFVNLRKTTGGIKRNCLVHNLVLLAFGFPRPSLHHEGCHFPDGSKTNNSVSNLRWGTRQENTNDAIKLGTLYIPGAIKRRLSDADEKITVQLHESGTTVKEICRRFGISKSTALRTFRKHRYENNR